MLKSKKLMKQNNKLKIQLKLQKFLIQDLWQYAIVIAFVCLFAWVFGKYIEAIFFIVSHLVIRFYYSKEFHFDSTTKCLCLTILIALLGIYFVLPLSISLLSAIPILLAVCEIGYIVQDRRDIQIELENIVYSTSLYKMTEKELRQFGASKGLSETQQDILVDRVIEHLKISEICKYKHYGRTTIKYHIAEIKRKLNIERI